MKNILLIILLVVANYSIKAQTDTYPKGSYMNFQEILDKTPSENFSVELEKRSKGKIKMNGGNDYQLNPIDENIKNNVLKKEVYAYSDGNDLYLNSFQHELQFWYSKVDGENDNYFVFNAGIPMNMKRYGMKSSDISYMFGGIIAGFSAAKRALIRLPYLMNKNTQEVILVSEKNIRDLMNGSTELIAEYEKETEKDNVETLNKYLIKWVSEK
ncbi:hypothetical protein SB49_12695 [Sediminicola sp. YIK13]|uniref:DUF6563 family protein n=1 Tax=Sediminicola sp. YIK13 TaxID=1453352 RepID=UPI000720D32C|nr:DUF6563 family protein [Sediminicola sp. YIK13]ALM08567.1 hypothetical protein SB49_12695 [Sediminicola sp. YIK13]